MTPIYKIIDDPKAPARIRGLRLTIVLDPATHSLSFHVDDVPDDATAEELSYLRDSITAALPR